MPAEARNVQPFAVASGPAMDEPIVETVRRDVLRVSTKFAYVCSPSAWEGDCKSLRQWDLWGPLFLCVLLSLGSWMKTVDEQKRMVFAFLFAFYWLGSFAVMLNISLLGGSVSYLQGVGVLGYTSFPLVGSCLVALCVPQILAVFKLVAVLGGAYMSTKASLTFISSSIATEKFYLALYPLLLFYAVICWTVCVL